MKTTQIAFIRKDDGTLDQLALIRFTHEDKFSNPAEVIEAFKAGVTAWVEKTEEGKKLWDYSSGDLNIGDLFGEEENEQLNECLAEAGIQIWALVYQLSEQEEISYDTVLAAPKEA